MRVHLIGAGGIGMSGIAQILLARGEHVSGSDSSRGFLLEKIQAAGGKIYEGHQGSHVGPADLAVYSSSITAQNPELLGARNRGIPVLHRGQMVAKLVGDRRTIAVTGAHGKSTTTAMAAELLLKAGLDPMALLGVEVESLGGNARAGRGPYAVVEADDSDGSLLWLRPAVAIITNVDDEHLDYFRNRGEILETYAAFASNAAADGVLVGCGDDPSVRRIFAANHRRRILYGLSSGSDVTAAGVQLEAGGSRYRCLRAGKTLGTVRLQVPGIHNVENSLGVAALALALGLDFRTAQAALEGYRGAKRRFQIQGEVDGVLVVEDYAHHPSEIQATLQAARSWPGRRIRCVFQPHRYSRTRYLLGRFASSFALADELILLPIYAASEDPIEGITSQILLQAVQVQSRIPAGLKSPQEALEQLTAQAESGDLILFLGAGNIGGLASRLVEALQRRGTKKEEVERVASLRAG